MVDALALEFMRNALMAGVLASVACGIVGSLVVVNRLVFLAGGVAHAAYGGVGLAFWLGLPVMPCAVGFASGTAALMGAVTRSGRERSDTVVGVLWAAGMAFGIILLDLTPGYNVDLMSYLFGSILSVPRGDLLVMLGVDIAAVVFVLASYKPLLVMSYDSEFARSRGVPVDALRYGLLVLAAVTVVMVIQVVGLILVIALMTIPSAMAERSSRSLLGMMVRAVLWSGLFCLTGLWLAYQTDITSGAAIIAVATFCFFGQMLIHRLRRELSSGRSAA